MIEDEIRSMTNDDLLAEINAHDPYDVEFVRRFRELEAERDRLRKLDAEYGRVEAAIIMADPEFDGNSPHDSCGDRLIASVQRIATLQTDTDTGG